MNLIFENKIFCQYCRAPLPEGRGHPDCKKEVLNYTEKGFKELIRRLLFIEKQFEVLILFKRVFQNRKMYPAKKTMAHKLLDLELYFQMDDLVTFDWGDNRMERQSILDSLDFMVREFKLDMEDFVINYEHKGLFYPFYYKLKD